MSILVLIFAEFGPWTLGSGWGIHNEFACAVPPLCTPQILDIIAIRNTYACRLLPRNVIVLCRSYWQYIGTIWLVLSYYIVNNVTGLFFGSDVIGS